MPKYTENDLRRESLEWKVGTKGKEKCFFIAFLLYYLSRLSIFPSSRLPSIPPSPIKAINGMVWVMRRRGLGVVGVWDSNRKWILLVNKRAHFSHRCQTVAQCSLSFLLTWELDGIIEKAFFLLQKLHNKKKPRLPEFTMCLAMVSRVAENDFYLI